jgi:hypothetical protein
MARWKFLKRLATADMVVKRRFTPRTRLILAVGGAVLLIAAVSFIYNYGLSMAGFERYAAERVNASLAGQIKQLETDNAELREGLARAQRTIQMDQTAYQELDTALKSSAQEIVRLREELNFYRNIISPADKKAGLRIQNLYILPDGGAQRFRYKLVLIQALKHDRTIYGGAYLEVSGTQGGQEAVLRFPTAKERPISVSFKYFQDIEGRIELPRDFRPRQVRVHVTTGGGGEAVEGTYAWPQA